MARANGNGRLHMVRLLLAAPRLTALAEARGLRLDQEDTGFLVHDQLAAVFQEGTVQPFRVTREQTRDVEVLGYSVLSGEELRDRATTFARPEAHDACDWDGFAVKEMPETLEAGRRLGFEVRVCPITRLSSDRTMTGKNGEETRLRCGAEVDAWLHRRFLSPEPDEAASRGDVYSDWLANRLAGCAELEHVRMTGFRRTRLVRKTHAARRKAKVLERPDAILQGALQVTDGDGFLDLLSRGVGRHKAFGFGMLLLRPPE